MVFGWWFWSVGVVGVVLIDWFVLLMVFVFVCVMVLIWSRFRVRFCFIIWCVCWVFSVMCCCWYWFGWRFGVCSGCRCRRSCVLCIGLRVVW